MSAQAGIWNFDGNPVDGNLLANLSESLKQQGPDGESLFVDGSVALLYRPFHTTAESRLEKQPYHSPRGFVVTWDGRLDNREELIHQLDDRAIFDHADVCIVAAAVDRWGTDSFSRLIGDWALSIWNRLDNELILARDYIGVKHLFYCGGTTRIRWCSHLAPLALSGDQFTLCEEYIAGYLAFHPDAHLTPYCEIHAVPPASFVRFRLTKVTVQAYWKFTHLVETRYTSNSEYEEHYRHVFRQAVRRRLRTDSPMLAELSGGLDSSSIVCMADDILAKEGAETPTLDTFSYYDSREPGEDDLPHVLAIEKQRGKNGLRVDLKGAGNSLALDYPTFAATPGFGHRAEIDTAISSVLQRYKYRVALSGTGGDEMNGQALDPRVQMADLILKMQPVAVAKQLAAWSLLTRRPWVQLLLETFIQLLPPVLRARLTNRGKLEPWMNREFARKENVSLRQIEGMQEKWFMKPSVRDAAQTISTLSNLLTYISPSTIEKRYPFLDQTLVEFLMTIPLDQLLRPGKRRFLMRRSLSEFLPSSVLSRKTKPSASRCYSIALQEHWTQIELLLTSPIVSRLGYVDRDQLHESLMAMKNGQIPIYSLRLLKALSLELWLRDIEMRGIIYDHASSVIRSRFAGARAS